MFFGRSFLKPVKYIDVVMWTSTILDVLLGSHINDYWNFDGGQELSGPWTGITQFTIADENLQMGTRGPGGG